MSFSLKDVLSMVEEEIIQNLKQWKDCISNNLCFIALDGGSNGHNYNKNPTLYAKFFCAKTMITKCH